MGNDGSGKTTIAKSVANMLRELGFRTKYKHEYDYAIIKGLFKIIGKERISKSRKEMIVEKKRSVVYQIWPILVWTDTLLQYLYYNVFRRDEIIILDRYAYDQYLSYAHLGNLTRFTKWLYLHFPKPEAAIVLAVAPQVAFERKKATHDYPLVFYKKQTEQYLNLAQQLSLNIVNTNEPLNITLSRIGELLFYNEKIRRKLFHKAIQNRVVISFMNRYKIKLPPEIIQNYEKRKKEFYNGILALKSVLDSSSVQDYALIKTRDEHDFVGNDIDVLVKPLDFSKLSDLILNKRPLNLIGANYDKNKDTGKMDIFMQGSLKLDLHAYVGWRNIEFLTYDQLQSFVQSETIFGIECKTLNEKANSFLILLTIFFEKGFMTRDEYTFLQSILRDTDQSDFDMLFELPGLFHSWIGGAIKNPPDEFPIFVPSSLLIRGYLDLLIHPRVGGTLSKRLRATMRDLSLMTFWRLRYRVNGRLPFEVPLY